MVDDPAGMVVDVDIPINGRLFTGPLTRSEEEEEEEEDAVEPAPAPPVDEGDDGEGEGAEYLGCDVSPVWLTSPL